MRTNTKRPKSGNWPTPSQETLIRAAVTDGEEGVNAWREWISVRKFDDIQYESFRMLGLIYHNLSKANAEEPDLSRMKGIFRRTWYKNQVLLNRLEHVIRLFRTDDIELLVIKGAPISILYYEHAGTRQMYDLDILVKPEDAERSIDLLTSEDWSLIVSDSSLRDSACLGVQYATHLKGENGIELDLHWYAMKSCRFRSADEEFWTRSISVDINGQTARTLDASGHLLHMCVHGIASHNTSPLRWVTDALVILKSDADIDWHYLQREIDRRQLHRMMSDALYYLRDVFNAPIPNDIFDRLDRGSARTHQALELWASTRVEKHSFAAIAVLWATYARREEGNGGKPSVRGFFNFLQCAWDVDSSRRLPITAVKKLRRRFAEGIRIRWSQQITH